ncbi:uncharacterized protein LAJ45_11575 [Morchella importuna]|nr:uncharacterized protein LAJ45_11575 [Morchella importuna]KAH8144445.1 hypothetical protein LAJ45_11575 [Morchella importuna]
MTSRQAKLESHRRYLNRPRMTEKELNQWFKKQEQDRKKVEEMERQKNRRAKAAARRKEKALNAPKPVPKLKEGQMPLTNFGFQKPKHDAVV